MGTQKICDQIIKEATEKATEQIKNASNQAAQLMKVAKDEAKKQANTILDEERTKSKVAKERRITSEMSEYKKAQELEKEHLMDKVFDEAIESFVQMELNKYEQFLEDLLLNTVQTGQEEVQFSKRDTQRLSQNFFERINQKLQASGTQANLKLSTESSSIRGGFILKEGLISMNCSIETLLSQIRDTLEPEVQKLLFEDEPNHEHT